MLVQLLLILLVPGYKVSNGYERIPEETDHLRKFLDGIRHLILSFCVDESDLLDCSPCDNVICCTGTIDPTTSSYETGWIDPSSQDPKDIVITNDEQNIPYFSTSCTTRISVLKVEVPKVFAPAFEPSVNNTAPYLTVTVVVYDHGWVQLDAYKLTVTKANFDVSIANVILIKNGNSVIEAGVRVALVAEYHLNGPANVEVCLTTS